MKCRGEGRPIVAARLHHHTLDRTMPAEPALEQGEPAAIGAKAQDGFVRAALALSADRRDVLTFADVDADAVHLRPPHDF